MPGSIPIVYLRHDGSALGAHNRTILGYFEEKLRTFTYVLLMSIDPYENDEVKRISISCRLHEKLRSDLGYL